MNRQILSNLQLIGTFGFSEDDKKLFVTNSANIFAHKPESHFDSRELDHIKTNARKVGLDYKKVLCDALMTKYYPELVGINVKKSVEVNENKSYKCNCGEVFVSRYALAGHKRTCKK